MSSPAPTLPALRPNFQRGPGRPGGCIGTPLRHQAPVLVVHCHATNEERSEHPGLNETEAVAMRWFETNGNTKARTSHGMSWIAEIAMVAGLALLINTIAAQAFYVPSGSMEPTLLIGDELMVSKFPYGFSRYSVPLGLGPSSSTRLFGKLPERGDVVVFRLPRDPSQTYVKRVIGLPGDRVQMREGRLWIDGTMLPGRRDGAGA